MRHGTVQIVRVAWDPLWLAKVIQYNIYIKLCKLPIFDVLYTSFTQSPGRTLPAQRFLYSFI